MHIPGPVLGRLTNIAFGSLLGYRASNILMRLVQAAFSLKKRLNFFIILVKTVLVFERWVS